MRYFYKHSLIAVFIIVAFRYPRASQALLPAISVIGGIAEK